MEKNKNDVKKEEVKLEGVNAAIEHGHITLKKDSNEIRRKLNPLLNVKIEGDKVIVESKRTTRKDKKIFGTTVAHIKNMIEGLNNGFTYRLQVASVHFPITLAYDKSSNEITVKNFLGEKKDRKIKLVNGVNVNIIKDVIEIKSFDIEKAGQSAANIEFGTKVRKKDRRIYQDGIFIIEKPGRIFK